MALTVKFVSEAVIPGKYSDGSYNLYLVVRLGRKNTYMCRGRLFGVPKDVIIGPTDLVSLKEARLKAADIMRSLANGIDPIEVKREQFRKAREDHVTFSDCAEKVIEALRPSWSNEKHAQQWANTLHTYVYPKFKSTPIKDITPTMVVDVLDKLWVEKTETATRVLSRMRTVFDWAIAKELRKDANPCASIRVVMPKVKRQKRNQPSMPYAQVPAYYASLGDTTAAVALKLTILTACRTNEIIELSAVEIDYESKVWTIPAGRMKAGKEHRVPLTDEMITLLDTVNPDRKGYIFKAGRRGTKNLFMSNGAMLKLMKDENSEYVPHGFRSSFRTWAEDETDFDTRVCEAALAHIIGNKVEAAYNKGELLEKRRELMTAWTNFVTGTVCA